MKNLLLLAFAICGFAMNAAAYKEVTTTITVPGTAKSVTTNSQGTTVLCDQSIWECYKVTTTTTEQKVQTQPNVGDKIEIEATDKNGVRHRVVGGFIRYSNGIMIDGTVQYHYELLKSWNYND